MKREKFKLETKKGQVIYKIEVNIRNPEDQHNQSTHHQNGIFVKKLKIVHQTKRKIVLSDEYVTVLDRQREEQKKESYYHFLNEIRVSIVTKETYWPNGVFSYCYSLEDPEKMISRMRTKIAAKIEKEYGFLRNMDIGEIIDGYIATMLQTVV